MSQRCHMTGGLGAAQSGDTVLGDVNRSWTPSTALTKAVDRRQAQVELDALIALSLGVTADELCEIYRGYFPVLVSYDRALSSAKTKNIFDENGRLVPNAVLTIWRSKGERIIEEERTATNASGNTYTYEFPFVTLDREADMRQAYAHFEKILKERS